MIAPLDQKERSWQGYLLLSLVVFFSFYFAIGSYPLFDNNEGLYASIAKSMLLDRSLVIPHLNWVPYIEKPPLLYWLLSLSFSVLGLNPLAARLVTGSSAALLCGVMLYFTRKINLPKLGIVSGLIFASSIGVSIIARMVYFDMLFTLLLSCTLGCYFYWHEFQKISFLRVGYLFFGLAVLTKGLVAVGLIGGSFGAWLILERDFRSLYRVLDPIGILVFLAVVLPWHLAAEAQHQGFLKYYLIKEHFLRFLNQREPHDYYQGPIYYYLPRIIIYLFPWSLFIPLIFWRSKSIDLSTQKLLRFCWCWLLIPLLFFSLSRAKANYYMIVSMPALAMILGIKIKYLMDQNRSKILSIWGSMVLFIVALLIGVGSFVGSKQLLIDNHIQRLMIIVVVYSLIAGVVAISMAKRSRLIVMMLAVLIIPVSITMVAYIKSRQHDLSSAVVGSYLTTHAKDRELYLYQDFENISALSFYAPRCFKLIDTQSSDLYYGAQLPQFSQFFVDRDQFFQETLNKPAYIVVATKKLSQFYQAMKPAQFSVVKRFNHLVIIEKRS